MKVIVMYFNEKLAVRYNHHHNLVRLSLSRREITKPLTNGGHIMLKYRCQ